MTKATVVVVWLAGWLGLLRGRVVRVFVAPPSRRQRRLPERHAFVLVGFWFFPAGSSRLSLLLGILAFLTVNAIFASGLQSIAFVAGLLLLRLWLEELTNIIDWHGIKVAAAAAATTTDRTSTRMVSIDKGRAF